LRQLTLLLPLLHTMQQSNDRRSEIATPPPHMRRRSSSSMVPPPHRPALLASHVPDCAPATVLVAVGALVYLLLLLWQAASVQACTTIVVGREATTGRHTLSDVAAATAPPLTR
jgi:hypothetical protein